MGSFQPAPQPRAIPRFIVSTDAVPVRDRAPYFREEMSRLLRLDMTPLTELPPHYTMDFTAAGPISISEMRGSPTRFVRAPGHVRDGDGDFTFVLFQRGCEELTHNGHVTKVDTSGYCLINNAIPSAAVFPASIAHTLAIRIDRSALGALVRHPEKAAGLPADPSSAPVLALLRGYLDAFAGSRDRLAPEVAQSFGRHIIDLVASIIGTTRDGDAQAASGGIRAARLREVLEAIAGRACDPGFGIEQVAGQLAVTTRYINRLLEETGHSFSEHVVEHRLRRAWQLLSDPLCNLKIASVAFECGFNDLSHFNRSFRRRFGETPTSVRGGRLSPAPEAARPATNLGELAAEVAPLIGHTRAGIPRFAA